MIVLACDVENEPGNVYLLNKFTGLPITGMNCYPGAALLGINCLTTFEYDGKTFFTHDQRMLIKNAMEVKYE